MVELVLVALAIVVGCTWLVGLSLAIGIVVGLIYGRWYWDGSEQTGRRTWPWFHKVGAQGLLAPLRWLYSYRLVEDTLPPPPALYAYAPHGMLALGMALTFLGRPRTRIAIHRFLFGIPIVRELFLWAGCIEASRDAIVAAWARNESVVLCPEGIKGMGKAFAAARPNLGFQRLAADYDIPIVYAFGDGEADLCWVWKNEWRWVTAVRALTARAIWLPIPTFCMPRRRARLTVYLPDPAHRADDDITKKQLRATTTTATIIHTGTKNGAAKMARKKKSPVDDGGGTK